MNDKKFLQIVLISTLLVIVLVTLVAVKANPVLMDLTPQSQHILQNYQNYLQTGQTQIPTNPSPIDQNQTGSPNQNGFCQQAVSLRAAGKPTTAQQDYYCQDAYAQYLNQKNSGIFGSYTLEIIFAIIILIIVAVAISAARS